MCRSRSDRCADVWPSGEFHRLDCRSSRRARSCSWPRCRRDRLVDESCKFEPRAIDEVWRRPLELLLAAAISIGSLTNITVTRPPNRCAVATAYRSASRECVEKSTGHRIDRNAVAGVRVMSPRWAQRFRLPAPSANRRTAASVDRELCFALSWKHCRGVHAVGRACRLAQP